MRRGVLSMVLGGLIASGATLGGGCGNSGVEFGTGNPGGTGGAGGGKATSVSTGATGVATSVSSTTASTSGSSSTSSTTSSGGCTADPQDNACVKCTKQSCCADLVPCQNDQACVCWAGCLSQNPGNPGACAGCGPYDAVTSAFVNCGVQHCSAPCGAGTSSSSSSTSTSSGGLCAPAAGDSQCTACAKGKCCNDVNACAASQNCVCWVACLTQGGSPQVCFGACGAPDAATNALSQCSLQQCPGVCP